MVRYLPNLLLLSLLLPALSAQDSPMKKPLVIAHRGASAYLPEHTLPAYALAVGQGADVIEPDVVMTKDGVLLCLHDIHLERVTNVREEFPERHRADGRFYAIDFTLAELRHLEVTSRDAPEDRGGFRVATLSECLKLARRLSARLGRRVGVIPEAKHPSFHRSEGHPMEKPLLEALGVHGFQARDSGALIQCFEIESLELMRGELASELPLVFLTDKDLDDPMWDRVARTANALGPDKGLLARGKASPIYVGARARGLDLYPWTFNDNVDEMQRFFHDLAVAGLFTNNPDRGVMARERAVAGRK